MSIEIGDAILKFLGDSSQLDTKFAEVQPNAEQAFSGAAEAVEEGTERMTSSMGEARGEAALLGEAFGIHLPRHVRSFVAELPGVGEALSAAFSATAVLFLLQAVVEVSEKVSNFIANTAIFTDQMRESNEAIANENKSLVALADIYNKAKERLDELNGVTKSWEDEQRKAAQTTVDLAKAQLTQMEATIANKSGWDKAKDAMKDFGGTILSQIIPGYVRLSSATQDQIKLEEKRQSIADITAKALRATNEVNQEEAAKNAKLALDNTMRELENQKKVSLAYATTDQEKYEVEQHFEERKLALLNEYAVKDKAAIQALMTTIEVQQAEHNNKILAQYDALFAKIKQLKEQSLNAIETSTVDATIQLGGFNLALKRGEDAAHSMGITLRSDLVDAFEKAKLAENEFISSGIQDKYVLQQLENEVKKAQKALDDFGQAHDKFKGKSDNTWKGFMQDMHNGPQLMQNFSQMGQEAFNQLANNVQSAFAMIISGQKGAGKAFEEATGKALESMAAQAATKAIFYTAEGLASLANIFGGQYPASMYFAAAAEMGVIAGVAGVAGKALAGSGNSNGSNNSNAQAHTSSSNTGQENRSGGGASGVQMFAEGGLISEPTLAIMGEAGREAVIPLDDPQATKQMRDAGIGGDTHHHWHIDGVISSDNLQKVVGKISKMVSQGRVNLTASNSLRLTKRSA